MTEIQTDKISSEEEYESVLDEIWQLWDSPIDSVEGKRLNFLIDLVEEFEEEHYLI